MKENGDIDQEENRIVEIILKGINIILVYSKSEMRQENSELKGLIQKEMNTLFKLTHHNVFRIQLQVFKLLLQFAKMTQNSNNDEDNINDRFYRSLYDLLLRVHTTGLEDYFGLIFKVIKSDSCLPRCIAFIKRLLQMCYLNEANFSAATILILSELFKLRQDIRIHLFDIDFKS